MTEPRVLLQKLLNYIGEQAKEIDPRGYQLSSAKGFVKRCENIAGIPGVEFDLKIEGDHIWLRVPRLEANKPPSLSSSQRGLFNVSDDPEGSLPSLNESALLHRINNLSKGKTSEESAVIEANGRALAKKELEAYMATWKSWAEGERPRRKTIDLYGDLFALKHLIETEETAKPWELVWGIGLSSWEISFEGQPVKFEYPLLTQALEISLDEKTMALEIRPRATDTRVEMDAFVSCQIPRSSEIERIAREHVSQNRERPITPFDPSSYSDLLKLIAVNLDSKGMFRNVLIKGEAIPPPGKHLVVTDTWTLLSRPRSNSFLFEDLRRLHIELETGCDIPVGPAALVEAPSDEPVSYEPIKFRGLSSRGESGGGQVQELYFPLPYNEEQVTIVQQLEKAPGVAVQGPPGTGKTHTIANIICHYLATGRRVLVTSRGEPALEVLQSKIPDEVRALTVALLSGDREGVRQFQASIQAIQHQVSQLNPGQTRQEIETLKIAIDRAHAELHKIDKRVDEIAMSQLSEVEVDGLPMKSQKLAEQIVSGAEQYDWFDDTVTLSNEHVPPLSEEEAGRLRQARRKLGADIVYVQAHISSADDLPSTKAITELHDTLSHIKIIENAVDRGEILALKSSNSEILQIARELLTEVDKAKSIAKELEFFEGEWPIQLRMNCRIESFASEREALESLFSDVDDLIEARAEFLKKPVDFPEDGLTSPKVKEAIARGVKTGKPFGVLSFGNGAVKQHLASVRVAGLTPCCAEDWAHVQGFIALHEKVISFQTRWNSLAEQFTIPKLHGGVFALRQTELTANTARKAHYLATHFDKLLAEKANKVFEKAPITMLTGNAADLETVRDHISRHLTRADLLLAASELNSLQEKLAGKTGPISESLRAFIKNELGNPEFKADRISARYSELIMELRRLSGLSSELACVRDYARRIEDAGAPKFASKIRSNPVLSGDDHAFPSTWRQAWNWARIRSYINNIEAREELVELSARRRNLEEGLARFYRNMVSKAAWLSTKNNATPRVLQALAGYATAIRRIGQGTGPNAMRYRRDAREAMLDAAEAVPCWIMNHARVSESMPANIGMFDLVIVDEASQSDLWALPAILRGKKILVVGDDKQVSPDAGFIDSRRIQELRNRFLTDQPYGTEMTPEKSLYDLAARVFAAYQVMLREHFRCVPPIIAYSNRVFYKDGIYPLRIPKGSERIDPPRIDIFVPDGFRDKRDCNKNEALAIAEEISAILEDKQFEGRTIGVISLLGIEQSKLIDSIVRSRCDAAELIHRHFECGEARTFQGSEKDIIFLSMVVDPTSCKALSGNLFEQRFNVAASRARDRMYLVRSVQISDLSDKDLRLSLLEHFNKPLVTDKEDVNNLIDYCESGFERQVFSELSSRGYRVIPQVKTGAYRIDMVVEGPGDTRLAVECDGDEFHGPDRWQHDMNRQRILERAGWTFWRCFASTWCLNKDDILSELLSRLSSMGIEPIGALEHVPSLVEKRVWQMPNDQNCEKDVA